MEGGPPSTGLPNFDKNLDSREQLRLTLKTALSPSGLSVLPSPAEANLWVSLKIRIGTNKSLSFQ